MSTTLRLETRVKNPKLCLRPTLRPTSSLQLLLLSLSFQHKHTHTHTYLCIHAYTSVHVHIDTFTHTHTHRGSDGKRQTERLKQKV